MKFMLLHRTNAHWESGAAPTMELVRKVGEMVGEVVRSGRLVAADGLRASSQGVRLNFVNGKRTVTKGPLVGGFAIFDLDSKAAAIDWALRYVDVLGEVELDILQVQG
jgi:hypothetical protein